MADPRHRLGHDAEDLTARRLIAAGWTVLARRWRTASGEIDLVCLDREGTLVGVEVRARRSPRSGTAIESVDARHVRRVRAALGEYAVELASADGPTGPRRLRVDLVTLDRAAGAWRLTRHAGIDAW